MNKITKNIENALQEYTRLLAEKYQLDQEELLNLWTETTKMKIRRKDAPKKPKSAYQNFQSEQIKIIREENPSISFGEISKITSNRWKELPVGEKSKYASAPVAHSSPSPVPSSSSPVLKNLSKSKLLEKATDLGLKIAKNKSKEFILNAIEEAMAKTPDTSPVSSESSPVDASSYVEEEEEEEDMLSKYKSMKPSELVEVCKKKGLASTGSKEILIRRLLNV